MMPKQNSHMDLEQRIRSLEQAEKSQRQAREELEQLFAMALDLICIADIRTTAFLKVNQAFTNTLGFSEEELIGRSFLDFLHPEDVEPTKSVVAQKLLRGDSVLHFENRYICKDGTCRWLSWVSHPDPKKGVTYAVARDITERKSFEEALQEREDLFHNVLKTIPDMVSLHDTDMNIIYSNWNGFGAVPEEKRLFDTKCYATYRGYDTICPDCQAKTVIQTKQPFHVEAKLPDNRWVDIRVLPLLNDTGNCHSFVEWVRDITERKNSEEALRTSEERLQAILEASPDPLVVYDDTGCPQYLTGV